MEEDWVLQEIKQLQNNCNRGLESGRSLLEFLQIPADPSESKNQKYFTFLMSNCNSLHLSS